MAENELKTLKKIKSIKVRLMVNDDLVPPPLGRRKERERGVKTNIF